MADTNSSTEEEGGGERRKKKKEEEQQQEQELHCTVISFFVATMTPRPFFNIKTGCFLP